MVPLPTPNTALLQATSLTVGWSGQLGIPRGGTNASTASGARTELGLAIGSDVQAYSSKLGTFAALTDAERERRGTEPKNEM